MDKANMSHYKALLRAIQYTIYTNVYCYHMKPEENLNGPWELRGYSYAYYAGDNYTRKSVTGWIVLINGVFISWLSHSQIIVTTSVKEYEYSAIM